MNNQPIDSSGIGIVVWGCSGGYRILCYNDVLKPEVTGGSMMFKAEIAETVKDIRSFIRIHRIRVDYYALEFTSNYKVYTIYRSSNDSGSGAFVAVTVYVTHHLKVHHMREILNEMMDGFYRTYMNTLTGAPLPVAFYDINKFNQVIQQHEGDITADVSRYMKRRSVQDNTPRIWVYKDDAEVDRFFDMPYYPRFYECQEVMFISQEIWEKQEEYGMKFPVQPQVIDDAGRPEGEGRIARFDVENHTLVSLKINDIPMDVNSADGYVANSNDILEITISHEYYEPWESGRISLEKALSNNILRRVGNEKLYRWNSNGYTRAMKPVENFLPLHVGGRDITAKAVAKQLVLCDGREAHPLIQRDDQWGFVIKGEQWEVSHSLRLYPCKGDFSHALDVMSGILPKSAPDGVKLELQQHEYRLAEGSAKPDVNVNISLGLGHCDFKLPCDQLTFLAPVGATVEFSAKGYRCTTQGTTLSFVPISAVPGGAVSGGAVPGGAVPEGAVPEDPKNEGSGTTGQPAGGTGQEPPARPPQRGQDHQGKKPKKSGGDKKEPPVQAPKPVTYTIDVENWDINNDPMGRRWTRVENGKAWRTEVTDPIFNLFNSNGVSVCVVLLNNPSSNADENRKKGFIVTMQPSSTYCRIVYKQSFFQRLGNKLVYSIGGLLALVLLAAGIYFFLFKQSPVEKKYGQIEAFYNDYYYQETIATEDSSKLMHLIDSCAIYAIDDKGDYNDQNDKFNDLAFKVVSALKKAPGNKAASLYLLYMQEKKEAVTPGVQIADRYIFNKPAFKDKKYVDDVKQFISDNPVQPADQIAGSDGSNVAQSVGPEENVAPESKPAPTPAESQKTTTANLDKEKLQNFKKKYDNLATLNILVQANIRPVRTAYNQLPKAEQKPEYDRKIKAYEEMVKANSYKAIQFVLQKYPNDFSQKQKAALQKVNSDTNYERAVRKKGQINIDNINKELQ